MSTASHSHASKADRSDESDLVAEANSLLDRLAGSKLGEEAKVLAAKLRDAASALKDKSDEALAALKAKGEEAQEQVEECVKQTEKAIKKNPWAAVGIAAAAGLGAGLIAGLLIRRD